MNGLGKQRCGCGSEPGVYSDDVEPRVGHLDTVSMGQGDILRVQVKGRAQSWGLKVGFGYVDRIGEGRPYRQRSRGENGLALGLHNLLPVGWMGRPRNRASEGSSRQDFPGEAPAHWVVGPDKEQPSMVRTEEGNGILLQGDPPI